MSVADPTDIRDMQMATMEQAIKDMAAIVVTMSIMFNNVAPNTFASTWAAVRPYMVKVEESLKAAGIE